MATPIETTTNTALVAAIAAAAVAGMSLPPVPTSGYDLVGQIRASADRTVVLRSWPGLTLGSGLTDAQRTANFTAIQAAYNYASANNLTVENPGGVIEFTSSGTGLVIKGGINGAYTRTGQQTTFVEFGSVSANGNPVITFGSLVSGGADMGRCNLQGFRGEYGNSQTGKTSANALVFGRIYFSRLVDFQHNGAFGGYFPGYRGFYAPSASGVFQFSNNYMDWYPQAGQIRLIEMASDGTGNLFQNVYCGGGSNNNRNVVPFQPVVFGGSGLQTDMVYNRVNVEWQDCNQVIYFKQQRSAVVLGLHLEGNILRGSNPSLFGFETASVAFMGGRVIDCSILAANISGSAGLVRTFDYGGNNIVFRDMSFSWDSYGDARYGVIDVPLSILNNSGNPLQGPRMIELVNLQFTIASGAKVMTPIELEPNRASSTYGVTAFIGLWRKIYSAGGGVAAAGRGKSQGCSLRNENVASRVLYGFHEDLDIYAESGRATVTNTWNLSKFIAPGSTVSGSAMVRRHGDTVTFNLAAPGTNGAYVIKDQESGLTYVASTTAAYSAQWEWDAYANSNAGGWRVNGALQTAA